MRQQEAVSKNIIYKFNLIYLNKKNLYKKIIKITIFYFKTFKKFYLIIWIELSRYCSIWRDISLSLIKLCENNKLKHRLWSTKHKKCSINWFFKVFRTFLILCISFALYFLYLLQYVFLMIKITKVYWV